MRDCIKRPYANERDALDQRKVIKRKQGKKGLHVYKCYFCRFFHLTHQRQ